MAKMSRLQQAYDNPNMRRFLNAIADAEGVKYGYNTLFGNQQFGDLSQHPNIKKAFKQTDGKTNYTTAAGRYQFIIDTWNGLAQQYGFKDFSPRNQDLGAIALIAQSGALDDVLMGRYQKAAGKLGGQWASLPSSNYAQPKRSWDQFNKYLGGSSPVLVQSQSSQKEFSPSFVDLNALGYKPQKAEQFQPSFIDLNKLGYQEKTNQEFQPSFVDLNALGYKR